MFHLRRRVVSRLYAAPAVLLISGVHAPPLLTGAAALLFAAYVTAALEWTHALSVVDGTRRLPLTLRVGAGAAGGGSVHLPGVPRRVGPQALHAHRLLRRPAGEASMRSLRRNAFPRSLANPERVLFSSLGRPPRTVGQACACPDSDVLRRRLMCSCWALYTSSCCRCCGCRTTPPSPGAPPRRSEPPQLALHAPARTLTIEGLLAATSGPPRTDMRTCVGQPAKATGIRSCLPPVQSQEGPWKLSASPSCQNRVRDFGASCRGRDKRK